MRPAARARCAGQRAPPGRQPRPLPRAPRRRRHRPRSRLRSRAAAAPHPPAHAAQRGPRGARPRRARDLQGVLRLDGQHPRRVKTPRPGGHRPLSRRQAAPGGAPLQAPPAGGVHHSG
uniref:Uncharacterized protein n=1 Tax=Arundo donax TaxID=35708 RepID=A0A0A9CT39_ARUDO